MGNSGTQNKHNYAHRLLKTDWSNFGPRENTIYLQKLSSYLIAEFLLNSSENKLNTGRL